jgi:hypothetical protein
MKLTQGNPPVGVGVGECVAVCAVGTRHTVSFPFMQSWISEEGVAYDTVGGIEKSNYH